MATMAAPTATAAAMGTTPHTKEDEPVDYFNLQCPIPYEEIHREALSELFFLIDGFLDYVFFCSSLFKIIFTYVLCVLKMWIIWRVTGELLFFCSKSSRLKLYSDENVSFTYI